MTLTTEIGATIRRDQDILHVEGSVARVAETKVVPLLKLRLVRRCRRPERHMTVITAVWSAVGGLLGHIEMNRVLGKALVLDLRCRFLVHDVMTGNTVLANELRSFHLVMVTLLASITIGVADIAVLTSDARIRRVIRQPVRGMRHDRLVAARAGL